MDTNGATIGDGDSILQDFYLLTCGAKRRVIGATRELRADGGKTAHGLRIS